MELGKQPGDQGQLTQSLASLQDSLPPISQWILIGELGKLKASMGEEHLVVQLEEFAKVDEPLKAVAKGHRRTPIHRRGARQEWSAARRRRWIA